MSAPRWVDAHSVNCYQCGALFDERNGVPNTTEHSGNDDGGTLCPLCSYEPVREGAESARACMDCGCDLDDERGVMGVCPACRPTHGTDAGRGA